MTSPPGIARTSEPLPGTQAGEGNRPLTSKREAFRHLRTSLGITGAQAHALYVAYARDAERPLVTAGRDYRPSFIDWLMRQAPNPRKTTVRKWRIGETGWRTTT